MTQYMVPKIEPWEVARFKDLWIKRCKTRYAGNRKRQRKSGPWEPRKETLFWKMGKDNLGVQKKFTKP